MKRGAKGGNRGNKNNNPKRRGRISGYQNFSDNDNIMDDDVDSFHKQRDIIPLDIIDDTWESDEDEEHPVLNFEYDKDNEDDDDADEMEDNLKYNSLAAKILRQQKYLRTKSGGVEDEMHDDTEDADKKKLLWSTKKNLYYNADAEVQSSDDEGVANEEEAEVVRLQKENAQSFSLDDFGVEHISEDGSDGEPTMEEILNTGETCARASGDKVVQDNTGTAYEEVNKDLNALSREEQMDVVYSSAPELVGLLSELNDTLDQLDKLNPLLTQVSQHPRKDGMHYVEVKQILLLSYCQAITFYLLLKSEGQPVRDHPVIARLVEIKNLLDKMKQLDTYFPSNIEQFLDQQSGASTGINFTGEDAGLVSNSLIEVPKFSPSLKINKEEPLLHCEPVDLVKVDSSKDQRKKGGQRKLKNDLVGSQSQEMLRIRAALEEKLKKDAFGSMPMKHDKAKKYLQMVNGKLATLDDFDDDALDVEGVSRGTSNGQAKSLVSSKLSQLVTAINKPKVVSGDDDLPKRDDIGERRRKHELRVLAGAGIKSMDDFENGPGTHEVDEVDDDMEQDDEMEGSEDDLYRQVEQKRATKLAAKEKIYLRTPAVPSLPEALVDGKRQITYQIEKNKGLTPNRKKQTENPRKKYKLKHQKAVTRRKGQVREMRKPSGPYGGEVSGINAGISRSIRFKT